MFFGDGTPAPKNAFARWLLSHVAKTAAEPWLVKAATDKRISEAYAACPRCDTRWPVFSSVPTSALPMPDGSSLVLSETYRSEEPFGEERREIDNSQSSIECERRFRVTKEWTRTVVLEREKAKSRRGETSLNLEGLLSIGGALEQTLRDRYSVTDEARYLYEEEISLKVGARTRVVVSLTWKRIWQHGEAAGTAPDGEFLTMPFRVVVGVTFDQRQHDIS